jgi:hypothetical protein
MSLWLKQSTATILKLGPFLDDTDGKTAETGLTIAQADLQISKNGAAFAQTSAASPTTTHDADGWYPIPLTTTDTATLGTLKVQVTMTGALPVWQDCMVVPANVWDSFFGADYLQTDTAQWNNAAIATPAVAGYPQVNVSHWNGSAIASPDAAGYPKVTIKSGTGTGEIATSAGVAQANTMQWNSGALPTLATTADVWAYTTRTLTAPTNITSTDAEIELGTDSRVKVSADAHTAGSTVAAVTGNVGGSVASVTGAVGSVTGAVGSVTGSVAGNVTGSVGSVATGGITAASFAANAITATVVADGAIDAGSVATDAGTKIADALLDRDMSDVTDNGTETRRTPLQAFRALRDKWAISGTTLTVYKENDTTASWTATVTKTAGNPVTANDPTSA